MKRRIRLWSRFEKEWNGKGGQGREEGGESRGGDRAFEEEEDERQEEDYMMEQI